MKYNLHSIFLVASLLSIAVVPVEAATVDVAVYDFGLSPATSLVSSDVDASSTASVITVGPGLVGSGFTTSVGNPASAYSIPDTGVNGQSTPAADDYFRFTITPVSSLSLASISFDAARFDNGVAGRVLISFSLDGGTTFTAAGSDFNINNGTIFGTFTRDLTTQAALQSATGAILFQLQFSRTGNADATGHGTYIDNIVVKATAVPVPAAAWLMGSALLGLVGIRRRRS